MENVWPKPSSESPYQASVSSNTASGARRELIVMLRSVSKQHERSEVENAYAD